MDKVTAVVLAAGLSTRMKSRRQKALHLVAGRPLVTYPVQACLDAGVREVVVVVGHQAEEVKEVVQAAFPEAPIRYATQAEPKGTAHAVLCARKAVAAAREVLIVNGDLPLLRPESLKGLHASFQASGGVFGLVSVILEDPTGFGRIVRDGTGLVLRVVEDRDASPEERRIREVNVGVYLARAEHLFQALDRVGSDNAKGEFYFTDVVALTREKGLPVGVYVLSDSTEAHQVNDRAGMAAAEAVLYRRKAQALMASGVTIHQPDTVMIDWDCEVGPDTEVWPCVEMHGGTRVGSGCVIGRGSVLTRVTIGDGVEVKPYCVMTDAVVEDDARVGPFAHLRPGSILRRGAHVGNFVEMKKSTLGPGSKANHLTYLGDCTVGSDVNIGAGTITCNFDGVHKLPTIIEDGAFIGSDTQLVAPVKVGREAYVGAGTTVTKDVPPGALALSRVPQTHILEYSKRKKK